MKHNKIHNGIILIIIGIILLLASFNLIHISIGGLISNVFRLWPLILICVGINILFSKYAWIKSVTFVLFVVVIIGVTVVDDSQWDVHTSAGFENISNSFSVDKQDDVKYGELYYNLTASSLDIRETSDYLLDADINNINMQAAQEKKDDKYTIDIRSKKRFNIFYTQAHGKKDSIALNNGMEWDINVNVAALDAEIYLKNINVKDLDINTGAGQTDVYFGDKYNTDVFINAGAGEVDLHVPKSTGVKIKINGAIKDVNFEDIYMKKNEDNYYVSDNYASADNTLTIKVNIGVGQIKLKTY